MKPQKVGDSEVNEVVAGIKKDEGGRERRRQRGMETGDLDVKCPPQAPVWTLGL